MVILPHTQFTAQPTLMSPLKSFSCNQMPKATGLTVVSVSDSPIKEQTNYGRETGQTAIKQVVADIANVSGSFIGPMVTDDMDIEDELSAISMTEDFHQMLEELESL